MPCGTKDTHCCWFKGEQCQYVEPSNRAKYKWQCSLKVKYKTWEGAHSSPEYIKDVKPNMIEAGYSCNCGDWPINGIKCNDCGAIG